MPYMKESDSTLWLCGDGYKSIGYIIGDFKGKAAIWYGTADIMPFMEYHEAREGEVFICAGGVEYINRGGWIKLSEFAEISAEIELEKESLLWA